MNNIIHTLLIIVIILSGSMHGMKRANPDLTPSNQDQQIQPFSWLPEELIDKIASYGDAATKDLMNKVCKTWHIRLHDKETIMLANSATVTLSHKIKKMFEYVKACNAQKLAIWLSVLTAEDINNKKDSGKTPLYIAINNQDRHCMQVLMKYGVNINRKKNWFGCTFLYKASRDRKTEIVQLLLDHGADVNQASDFGASPLYVASYKGHPDVVKLLLTTDDIDVNQANKCGWTPLFAAAYHGHIEVVRLLLEHNADVHKKIVRHNLLIDPMLNDGDTALQIAQKKGYTEIVQLIQERLRSGKL